MNTNKTKDISFTDSYIKSLNASEQKIDVELLTSVLLEVVQDPNLEILNYSHIGIFHDEYKYNNDLFKPISERKKSLDDILKKTKLKEINFKYLQQNLGWLEKTLWLKT